MKKTSKLCKKRKIFKWKIVCFTVTPLAGVWVEIRIVQGKESFPRPSLPLRECGLKYQMLD